MAGWGWGWWWWVSWIVDQDELAEVELVGESFPFGLVQDAFVVVVSGSQMLSASDYTDHVSLHRMCVLCVFMPGCNAYGLDSCSCIGI